jgi:uncharacterized protein YuzE
MRDVYVKTAMSKKKPKVHRTVSLGNGVQIDVNDKAGIVGVEVLDAAEIKVNGKKL